MKRVLILIPVFSTLILTGCGKQQEPRLSELERHVRQLSDENQALRNQMREMQQKIAEEESAQRRSAAAQTQTAAALPPEPQMTVEQMKRDLQPLLVDFIQKLKAASDTPRKGNQYGMRIEYDLAKAVYGLVRNDDPEEPFRGRVIVPYVKYLESETDSKSYSEGNTEFYFTYQDGQWSLQTFQ